MDIFFDPAASMMPGTKVLFINHQTAFKMFDLTEGLVVVAEDSHASEGSCVSVLGQVEKDGRIMLDFAVNRDLPAVRIIRCACGD